MWSHHDVYLAIACVIRIVVETADRTAELFFCRVSKGLDLNGCLIHKKLGCKLLSGTSAITSSKRSPEKNRL
jgi:hypothetical protein